MSPIASYLAQYKVNARHEILAGLTTALALVPEVVAFALLAHISPLAGIGSACIICLLTSLFGGRPGMISGAAGSVAVVIVSLVVQHGPEYLFAAVILMGLLQIGIGLLRFGKFIRLVPQPVVYGFVNGLALIIFMAQLEQFKEAGPTGEAQWLSGTPLLLMAGLVALTMAIVYFLPRFTKALPASLAAILVVSALVIFGGLDTRSVGDIASISGGLPTFHLPQVPFTWATLTLVFPYALIMALVGLTESLLTLTVVDEMTDTRGRGNQDCVAQGLANLTSGFCGGMGGCAMIGQTMVNLESRGRGRLSGVVAALALAFAWENARRIRARKYVDEAGAKHYEIYGPLFFGSTQAFTDKFDVLHDPAHVVIDFRESRVADMSGLDALHKLTERYQRAGKTLHLRHLSPDCRQLLHNAAALIEVNILEDPAYRVATEAG